MTSTPECDLVRTGRFDLITGIDLPQVKGVNGCGAQALAAVLAYVDQPGEAHSIAIELPWHDVGATPIDLLLEARRRGFDATITRGTIEALAENIQADRPVLVMLDAGWRCARCSHATPPPLSCTGPWSAASPTIDRRFCWRMSNRDITLPRERILSAAGWRRTRA
jgi:hypothetical protein